MAASTPHVNQPVLEDPNSSKKYFRFIQDPEQSWKPYREEPMYDDHPTLATYKSTMFVSNPRAGDYLVQEPDGSAYVMRPSDLERFDTVEFDAMPPLDELLKKGIVVEVPDQIRKLDYALQDKMSTLNADIVAEDIKLADLSDEMENKRFGFPTKAARQARVQYEELKPKFDAMCEEYATLEAELNEKVVKPLTEQGRSQTNRTSLTQVISNAEDRLQQKKLGVAQERQAGKGFER